MTVSFKAPVKSAVVNNAFVSKQADDTKVGKLGLNKASEGGQVFSVQKSVNELFDVTGTGEGDPNAKVYNNENYITNGDSHKTAIEKLDAQVKNNADTIQDHINEATDAHDATAISYDNTTSGLVAIEVQGAIDEVENRLDITETDINNLEIDLSNHLTDTSDAHDASAVSYVNTTSGLTATDLQAAVDEVDDRLDTTETDIQAIEDSIGQANGITPLNGSSKIDAIYLPSYVDDVLEYADFASLPVSGETGKIYVTLNTNKTYRWTGSIYVEISTSEVTSVNSQSGAVVLDADDITETSSRYWSKKNNVANTMPLVGNDASQNYSVGSQWYDAINDTLYICEDATVGAAVWQPISGAGGGVGSVDIMFADTFENTDIADYTISQPFAEISDISPLQGDNSLLIEHDFNTDYFIERIIPIDDKFKNKNVTFSLDVFSDADSGNLTLSVWDHTNTIQLLNSELIQPQEVNQTSVKRSFSFNIPSGANELRYRINVFFDSGKISRVDNLVIELTETARLSTIIEVPVITEWQSYVPAFQGFGTPTNVQMQWRKSGQNVEIRGRFNAGTVTAIEGRVGLPNAYNSADSILIPSLQIIGQAEINATGTVGQNIGSSYGVYIEPSVSYVTFGARSSGTTGLSKLFPTNIVSTGGVLALYASVPIQGLTATETQSVSLAQTVLVQESDSALRISGVLGYGSTNTRVVRFNNVNILDSLSESITYIPNATLGDSFRINKKGIYNIAATIAFQTTTGGAFPFIVKNPTNLAQSNSDLIPVEEVVAHSYTTGGASGNPDMPLSATLELEVDDVLWVTNPTGSPVALVTGGSRSYIQITHQGSLKQVNVSENQKIEIPTSELRMEGASTRGTGSDSAIVRFDNIAKLRGNAFTVESTAALGTVITIKKAGKLDIGCSLVAGTNSFGISKNHSIRTNTPTIASEIIKQDATDAGGQRVSLQASVFCEAGDVFRIFGSANPSSSLSNSLEIAFQEQQISVSVTNALPQFSESDSSVRVDTANGYGSPTGTKIRRFSNVRDNLGSAIEYVPNAVSGDSFLIKESGIYHVSYTDTFAGDTTVAISKNSANLTTNASALANNANNELLAMSRSGSLVFTNVSWQGYLQKDDVIRAHTDGQVAGDNDNVKFTISKVGKPNVTGVDVTPFAKIEYEVKQFIEALTATTTFGGTRTGVPVLNITKNTNNGLIRIDSSAANGTEFFALKRCSIDISANAEVSNASLFITKNSTLYTLVNPDGVIARSGLSGAGHGSCSAEIELNVGDIIRVQRNGSTVTPVNQVSIVATELRDAYQVIGGGIENTYSALISITPTITSQSYPFIESVTSGGTGIRVINFVAGFFEQTPFITGTANVGVSGAENDFFIQAVSASSVTIRTTNSNILANSAFTIMVQRQGDDYRTPSKAIGLPAQRIAVLKDVKATGTAMQPLTASVWTTRVLNNLSDPTGLVTSLALNQFILPSGKYKISARCPAMSGVGGIQFHKAALYNVTDSTNVLIGTTERTLSPSGSSHTGNSVVEGHFTLTASKTLDIRHIVGVSYSADAPPNFSSTDEVYTVVVIEKIEE